MEFIGSRYTSQFSLGKPKDVRSFILFYLSRHMESVPFTYSYIRSGMGARLLFFFASKIFANPRFFLCASPKNARLNLRLMDTSPLGNRNLEGFSATLFKILFRRGPVVEFLILSFLLGWIKGIFFLFWIPSCGGVELSLKAKLFFSLPLALGIMSPSLPYEFPFWMLAFQEGLYGSLMGILFSALEVGLAQGGRWTQVPLWGISRFFTLIGWSYLISIQFPHFLWLSLAYNPLIQANHSFPSLNLTSLAFLFSKIFVLAFSLALPFLLTMAFYEALRGIGNHLLGREIQENRGKEIVITSTTFGFLLLAPLWVPRVLQSALEELVIYK